MGVSAVAIGFAVFLGLILLRIPIGFAMGIGSVLTILIQGTFPLTLVPQRMFVGLDSFPLLAIPLFIFVGQCMNTSGVTDRLFKFATVLVRHLPGSLGHVNVVASIIFAGMSGSAVADASGLGLVEIKAMTDEGYDIDFSAAITAASSTIGPIIPPSIPLVVYGFMSEVSIGRLFLAGVIPGLLMGLALMVYVYIVAIRGGYPRGKRASLREIGTAFFHAAPALFTPILMLGGIASGVFTPTEGAAVTAMYTLFLGFVLYRELTLADLRKMLASTARSSAVILFIIAAASTMIWPISVAQVPQLMAKALLGFTHNPYLVLALINVLLLVLGCFMESMAILTLGLPILLPIVTALGIDPVHFGIVMVLNLMIGLITPPVGLCLYVVANIGNIPVSRVIRATTPYLIPLVAVLLMVTYLPGLTLWLPNLLMGVAR